MKLASDLRNLKMEAKDLASRYYRLTGKPLGITGEMAELEAAELLGLELSSARQTGYDAIRHRGGREERIQIKGRAVDSGARFKGRCPAIKCGDQFDFVLLVLLDRQTLEPLEIWEATEKAIVERLDALGSKSRNDRRQMGLSQFKTVAERVWSDA